jgi:hypothetical protein
MTGRLVHHTIDYIELPVTDVARAKQFYADAFGWRFTDYGPDYAGIAGDTSGEVGGLAKTDDVRPGGPLVVLFSADLDASVAAIEAAGGTITEGPFDFPGGRRFHFADPSGNRLGVWAQP